MALSLVPLAGLAHAVSVLLHRLSEEESAPEEKEHTPTMWPALASEIAGETVYAMINTDGVRSNSSNTAAHDYSCRYCQMGGLTKAEQLAHGRQRARTGVCPAG